MKISREPFRKFRYYENLQDSNETQNQIFDGLYSLIRNEIDRFIFSSLSVAQIIGGQLLDIFENGIQTKFQSLEDLSNKMNKDSLRAPRNLK